MLLTDLSVRQLKGSANNPKFFDTKTPSFGIRCGLKRKTWVVMRGRNRELVTIGHYPAMSVSDARTKAKKLLSNEPEHKAAPLRFKEASKEFLATHYANSTSDWPTIVKLILRKHFKGLNGKRLGDITDADIKAALNAINGPSARVHAFRVGRTFFRWCTRHRGGISATRRWRATTRPAKTGSGRVRLPTKSLRRSGARQEPVLAAFSGS